MAAEERSYIKDADKNVVISTLIKEKAKDYCDILVKDFKRCARGRNISLAWACREEHRVMKQCLETFYRKADMAKIREEADLRMNKEQVL